MAMGFNAEYTVLDSGPAADFNSAADTVLVSKVLPAGGTVRRIGYVGDSSDVPGTSFTIKASYTVDGGATWTDLFSTAAQNPSAARGQYVYANAASRTEATVPPGAIFAVRVGVAGASDATGHVFAEVEEQPFSGTNIPANAINATTT